MRISFWIFALLFSAAIAWADDFASIVYANSSLVQYTEGWESDPGGTCTAVVWEENSIGGPLPPLPFCQADNDEGLPISFTFKFNGTQLNVVGNDWRNGIAVFTLDGEPSNPYDLALVTKETGLRCRFPWYTNSSLAPTEHIFTFTIVSASPQTTTDTGKVVTGSSQYLGVQFFYFSYTPLPEGNTTTTGDATNANHHKGKGVAIGVGVGCGIVGLAIVAFLIYYCVKSRSENGPREQVDLDGSDNNPWDPAPPRRVTSPMMAPSIGHPQDDPYSIVPTAWIQHPLPTNPRYLSPQASSYDGRITPTRSSDNQYGTSQYDPYAAEGSTTQARTSTVPSSPEKTPLSSSPPPQSVSSPETMRLSMSTVNEADLYRVVAETVMGMFPDHIAAANAAPPPVYTPGSEQQHRRDGPP